MPTCQQALERWRAKCPEFGRVLCGGRIKCGETLCPDGSNPPCTIQLCPDGTLPPCAIVTLCPDGSMPPCGIVVCTGLECGTICPDGSQPPCATSTCPDGSAPPCVACPDGSAPPCLPETCPDGSPPPCTKTIEVCAVPNYSPLSRSFAKLENGVIGLINVDFWPSPVFEGSCCSDQCNALAKLKFDKYGALFGPAGETEASAAAACIETYCAPCPEGEVPQCDADHNVPDLATGCCGTESNVLVLP